jgi:hypothetical protein
MSLWERVNKKMGIDIKAVGKLIRDYDYSTEDRAEATDVKICSFMIEEIRKAKDKLFNIIQTSYELHEGSLNRYFQGLKDDLDIFSDEIKVRHFEWSKDISDEWMERLIKHDHELIGHTHKLNQELEGIYQLVMDVIKLYPERTNPEELEQVRKMIKVLEKDIDNIVLIFKEREAICNIKPLALEKTYQQMQDYYKRLV